MAHYIFASLPDRVEKGWAPILGNLDRILAIYNGENSSSPQSRELEKLSTDKFVPEEISGGFSDDEKYLREDYVAALETSKELFLVATQKARRLHEILGSEVNKLSQMPGVENTIHAIFRQFAYNGAVAGCEKIFKVLEAKHDREKKNFEGCISNSVNIAPPATLQKSAEEVSVSSTVEDGHEGHTGQTYLDSTTKVSCNL